MKFTLNPGGVRRNRNRFQLITLDVMQRGEDGYGNRADWSPPDGVVRIRSEDDKAAAARTGWRRLFGTGNEGR